jgi:hypothetical protein
LKPIKIRLSGLFIREVRMLDRKQGGSIREGEIMEGERSSRRKKRVEGMIKSCYC